MLDHLSAYLLSTMISFSPPENHLYLHEGIDFTIARYTEIANDIAKVAFDNEPFDIFSSESYDVATAHSALLLVSIASFESGGFRNDVDRGAKKGDAGRSVCILQVLLRPGEQVRNRTECIQLGYERVKESLDACKGLPMNERLSVYASGSCTNKGGLAASKVRYGRMEEWWKSAPFYGMIGGK